MREESQLDDMRTAIRGDFARLEQRRGVQELMHVREREPDRPSDVAVGTDATKAHGLPRTSWLARLVAAIPPRQV